MIFRDSYFYSNDHFESHFVISSCAHLLLGSLTYHLSLYPAVFRLFCVLLLLRYLWFALVFLQERVNEHDDIMDSMTTLSHRFL